MKKLIITGTTILVITITAFSMGLFDKLFVKKNTNHQTTISANDAEHEEEWEFFLSNVNERLSSHLVDIGLYKTAPMTDKPNAVWVSIKMNNPREDGLSSKEENKLLVCIEDKLVDEIMSKHNSIYVGRHTSAGNRDLYFYFGDTTLYDNTISEVMVAYPQYQYDLGSKQDKDWWYYFDLLYPSPEQFQSIQNRRVLDNLQKYGDKLTKAREVNHCIYFKTEKDREAFLKKISNDGFSILEKEYDKELDETPYTLNITRVDKVDQNSVDEYVIYLWQLATECNGDYDGWETSVEKD